MKSFAIKILYLILILSFGLTEGFPENTWMTSDPILLPGSGGSFDEIAVKDPSMVYFDGKWHLFYTARSNTEYTTGYVSAEDLTGLQAAQRFELKKIRGKSRYGCAPQIFFFEPQNLWYLIFQNRDSNYQPAFSTTKTISEPESWSKPLPLIRKDVPDKWIDFWIICDEENAFLFYTQEHRAVFVRSTDLNQFPEEWSKAKEVFSGIHEAVHIYKVIDQQEYHMIYELNHNGIRSFGLATAQYLTGPWKNVTDHYATGEQLKYIGKKQTWTEMVSHGEVLRAGCNQKMEYQPDGCQWLIQGILLNEANGPYPSLPWKLGIIRKSP
jgi:hypothetical protein